MAGYDRTMELTGICLTSLWHGNNLFFSLQDPVRVLLAINNKLMPEPNFLIFRGHLRNKGRNLIHPAAYDDL